MFVEVTEEDIENGGKGGSNCPIALALKRKKGVRSALVTLPSISIRMRSGRARKFSATPAIRRFIQANDRGFNGDHPKAGVSS